MSLLTERTFISDKGIHPAHAAKLYLHTPTSDTRIVTSGYTLTRNVDYVDDSIELLNLNITVQAHIAKLLALHRHLCEIHFVISDSEEEINPRKYRALLHPNNDLGVLLRSDIDLRRLEGMQVTIDIQLLDIQYEQLDHVLLPSMIVEDTNISTFTKAIIPSTLKGTAFKKVVMHNIDNTEGISRLVVKSGTYLLDLVHMLQTHYGIYNTGANMFFGRFGEEYIAYVYPTHNIRTVTKPLEYRRNLIIVIGRDVGAARQQQPSYYVNRNNVRIIGTDIKIDETRVNLNPAVGVSEPNAPALTSAPTEASATKPFINKPSRIMNHYTIADRDDKQIPLLNNDLTRNKFETNSNLVKDQVDLRLITWDFSDSSLLVPGMDVEIIEMVEDTEVRQNAVVTGFDATTIVRYNGDSQGIGIETTVIKLAIKQRTLKIQGAQS